MEHKHTFEIGYGFLKPGYFGPYTACSCGIAIKIDDTQTVFPDTALLEVVCQKTNAGTAG